MPPQRREDSKQTTRGLRSELDRYKVGMEERDRNSGGMEANSFFCRSFLMVSNNNLQNTLFCYIFLTRLHIYTAYLFDGFFFWSCLLPFEWSVCF